MKVSTENDNNFGYEKITILVDNMPLNDLTVIFQDVNILIIVSMTRWTIDQYII